MTQAEIDEAIRAAVRPWRKKPIYIQPEERDMNEHESWCVTRRYPVMSKCDCDAAPAVAQPAAQDQSDDDLLRRLDQTVISGTGWGMPRIDGISLDVVAGRAAARIRELQAERDDLRIDRDSHQRVCIKVMVERDAAIKALRELLAGCTDPDHDCIQEIAAARAALTGPKP